MNLLRLPEKSLIETLRYMRIIDLVSLSFTSKASKKAVESINLNIGDLNVKLEKKTLTIELKNTDLWFQLDVIFKNVETIPRSVRINKQAPVYYSPTVGYRDFSESSDSSDCSDTSVLTAPSYSPSYNIWSEPWNNILSVPRNTNQITFKNSALKFTARDYLRHLMDILNRSSIEIENEKKVHGISEKGARALFRDIPIKKMYSYGSFNSVLKYTYNQVERLKISKNKKLWRARTILCSQFNCLRIFVHFNKLDDLLNFNSRLIDLDFSRFTEKDLNLYLKHWALGLTHQNLKRLRVSSWISFTTTAVLNGIRYQKQPTSVSRSFGSGTYCGGYDIQRNDETDATIYIFGTRSDFNLILIVWE